MFEKHLWKSEVCGSLHEDCTWSLWKSARSEGFVSRGFEKRLISEKFCFKTQTASYLTLSWWRSLSYRIQSIDSQSKSMDWFLYDRDLHHERVRQHLFAISLFPCKRLYLQINPKVSSWVARYSGDCAPDCHH